MMQQPSEVQVVEIMNRHGLHARPAAQFVKVAGSFEADVTVEKDGMEVNGKSIMGVLMLAAAHGSRMTIRCTGADAEKAVSALAELVSRGFDGEDGY